MRLRQIFSKFLFCLKITGHPGRMLRLMYYSKRFTYRYRHRQVKNGFFEPKAFLLNWSGKQFTLYMRLETGDIMMFYEIFWSRVYSVPQTLLENPKVIVDLGANVGFTSLFFKLCYPGAQIFALEPSASNYAVMVRNSADWKGIQPLQAAVWNITSKIGFKEADYAYNSKIAAAGDTENYEVQAWQMGDFMTMSGIRKIDLLKIDIEGAEKQILGSNNNWLNQVQHILIELHPPYNINLLRQDLALFGFEILVPPAQGLKVVFAFRQLVVG